MIWLSVCAIAFHKQSLPTAETLQDPRSLVAFFVQSGRPESLTAQLITELVHRCFTACFSASEVRYRISRGRLEHAHRLNSRMRYRTRKTQICGPAFARTQSRQQPHMPHVRPRKSSGVSGYFRILSWRDGLTSLSGSRYEVNMKEKIQQMQCSTEKSWRRVYIKCTMDEELSKSRVSFPA
nr:hypothetical protein CFP56_54505 [Quercus suber]